MISNQTDSSVLAVEIQLVLLLHQGKQGKREKQGTKLSFWVGRGWTNCINSKIRIFEQHCKNLGVIRS